MKNAVKTFNIKLTEEGYINLMNLLTLTDVTDEDIKCIDIDSDCEVNVSEIIRMVRQGFDPDTPTYCCKGDHWEEA